MRYPTVVLSQPIEGRLRAGHPWVFADALLYDSKSCAKLVSGDVVDVVTREGAFVGRGLFEPDSPIRVRIWTTNPSINLNNQLLESRIKLASKRRPFPTPLTNGFRLLNGEGDRTPGVTCDIYDKVAVLRIDGSAAERWIQPAVRIIKKLYPIEYVAVRRSELYRGTLPAAQWYGEEPDSDTLFTFLEGGIEYVVDPIRGQKTGFFLDQRANRRLVAEFAQGKRLLNLFSYSGGFSLAAAVSGAYQTTSVDLSAPALTDARRNFERNGIPSPSHEFIAEDVFLYLSHLKESSAPFEIAVCDPPSFAHKKEDVKRAQESYIQLFSTLIRVMPHGSRCAFASCSSQIDRARFISIVQESSKQTGTSLISHGLGEQILIIQH